MLQPQQLDDVAHHYPSEIADLRSFLAKAGLALDTPDSLHEVAARLEQSRSFRRDLTSHIWVVLHAAEPPAGLAELLAMLAAAAAGTHFAAAADEADAHTLLRFLMQARQSFGAMPPGPGAAIAAPVQAAAQPHAGALRHWPASSTPGATAPPDAQTLFLQSSAAFEPAVTPWQRRPIVWAGAAACLLLLTIFGLWFHGRSAAPAAAPIVAATPPSSVAPSPALQTATVTPPAALPSPRHRTPPSQPRSTISAARPRGLAAHAGNLTTTASTADNAPAAPAAVAPRTRSSRRAAPATAPATAVARLHNGVPAVTPVDLGNPTAPRSNPNARVGGAKDTVIATLGTPIVRPTSLGIMASHVLYFPSPAYPEQASLDHVQGEVKLEAEVDRNGNVISTRVISGPPQLRAATEDAVQHWRYRPYMYDGKPIAMNADIVVDYQLP